MYNPQIETFIRVAESKSFNKAAKELYITSTAVIKQINTLESRLGLTLFDRSRRGLTLTPAGESLYRDSLNVVKYSMDSVERAKAASNVQKNVIRIGSTLISPVRLLVELLPDIKLRCSDMTMQFVTYGTKNAAVREVFDNLGTKIDVVIGYFDDSILGKHKCAATELLKVPFKCAMSVHHRLARRDKIAISDLYGETVMLRKRGFSSSFDAIRDELEKHPWIKVVDYEYPNIETMNYCENSGSIMLITGDQTGAHPLLKTIPGDWDYTMPLGIYHAKEPSETVRRFIVAAQDITKIYDAQIISYF